MHPKPILGALRSPYDPRRINMTQVLPPTAINPTAPIIDQTVFGFPVQNQLLLGICVSELICDLMETYIYKTTGKKVKLSRRDMMAQCKIADKQPTIQGTYIPIAAMIAVNQGCCEESFCPTDTTLSWNEFISVTSTSYMDTNRKLHKMPGVIFPNNDLNSIRQALASYGDIGFGIDVGSMDNNNIYPPSPTQPMIGSHAVKVYGNVPASSYNVTLFKNSWGTSWGNGGYGSLLWSQFNGYIFDVIAFTVIPQAILDKVQGMNTDIIKLNEWCLAAQAFEGWFPGSASFKNNNPGNLKYIGQPLSTGPSPAGFAVFPTYNDGYATLYEMFYNACSGKSEIYKPTMTLLEFYNVYAPPSDNNPTNAYAAYIAKKLDCTVDTIISTFIQ